jgi:alanyl-tRNA synthetase
MTSNQIRERFLDYFERQGHKVVRSCPLIPPEDPTLLFTNAGMVQFKKVFLGQEERAYSRAASCQKCLRAGGKHSDIENVGRTTRHHTFFEMLGNFSFGDYFKEEAVGFAWELLTEEMRLPVDKLWVTVFKDDRDAYDIWREKIGVPKARIVRMGEKDNFWVMGDVGPCGPCSEIMIDRGEEFGCRKPDCRVGCDCDRFLELWNLVFMEFNRDQDGKLAALPKKGVDTGMGLERIACVLQGVETNYHTDLFSDVVRSIEQLTGRRLGEGNAADTSIRVIADHSRAIAFLMGDGILPSNEGRGYVLRRITRRAIRHGRLLGIDDPFLHKTAQVVVDAMSKTYPDLLSVKKVLSRVVTSEEERFSETLDHGLGILNGTIEELKTKGLKDIPGDVMFKLYDTYGFPVDIISDVVYENGLTMDMVGFNALMKEQRERSRKSWKEGGREESSEYFGTLRDRGVSSRFVGYDSEQAESKILLILKGGKEVTDARTGDKIEVVAEETPFYGEAGGQVGDTGWISDGNVLIEIEDTLRPEVDLIVHRGRIKRGHIRAGDLVRLAIDTKRRRACERSHTATHILHAALRQLLGKHVKQAGSLVAPDRLRFDFTHYAPVKRKDLRRIEALVNEKIAENAPLSTEIIELEEALRQGAIALFGEHYQDTVRSVKIPEVSHELCGGTHVQRTGDIGFFKILSETGVAAGVRRIEALTTEMAVQKVQDEEEELRRIAQLVKAPLGEIVDKVEKLLAYQKKLEKDTESLKNRLVTSEFQDILRQVKQIQGISVVSAKVRAGTEKELRSLADRLKDKMKSGIIVLGGEAGGKALLIAAVTKDLTGSYHAGHIVRKVAQIVGGGGGGRADMAQAGGTQPERLPEALEAAYSIISEYEK